MVIKENVHSHAARSVELADRDGRLKHLLLAGDDEGLVIAKRSCSGGPGRGFDGIVAGNLEFGGAAVIMKSSDVIALAHTTLTGGELRRFVRWCRHEFARRSSQSCELSLGLYLGRDTYEARLMQRTARDLRIKVVELPDGAVLLPSDERALLELSFDSDGDEQPWRNAGPTHYEPSVSVPSGCLLSTTAPPKDAKHSPQGGPMFPPAAAATPGPSQQPAEDPPVRVWESGKNGMLVCSNALRAYCGEGMVATLRGHPIRIPFDGLYFHGTSYSFALIQRSETLIGLTHLYLQGAEQLDEIDSSRREFMQLVMEEEGGGHRPIEVDVAYCRSALREAISIEVEHRHANERPVRLADRATPEDPVEDEIEADLARHMAHLAKAPGISVIALSTPALVLRSDGSLHQFDRMPRHKESDGRGNRSVHPGSTLSWDK